MIDEKELGRLVGKNISEMLELRGKTKAQLADFLGVSQAAVSTWCSGSKTPRMDKIDNICRFLNVPRSAIISERITDGLPEATDDELKFALFGGLEGVTDEMLDEVKSFAEFAKHRTK